MKYLVIVESPAKIKKITKILAGIQEHSFIVAASYGHVRYFKNGLKSIDISNNFKPTYSVIKDKIAVVAKLRKLAKEVDEVIIATDNDREGEAIGYHLLKILNKSVATTKRIYFNEITKPAIIEAFRHPKTLNMDEFNAQQARSILDLLIGFKISPLLWRHIKEKLSAGRCQTPALRLVFERETAIMNFIPKGSYELTANFSVGSTNVETKYFQKIPTLVKTRVAVERLVGLKYKLKLKRTKRVQNKPPAPFITSTIQQEASNKFNISPKSTMSILQKLYEGGKITYMRTDSPVISEEFIKICKGYINEHYGSEFTKRVYKVKTKNAQEAHECIRPVLLDITEDDIGDSYERKLYGLIWRRTIACFLPNYIESHCIFHFYPNTKEYFETIKKIVVQRGFRKLYNDRMPDDATSIQLLNDNIALTYTPAELTAYEKFTKPKGPYTEASLVKDLEGKGIGRPSTFSNIVNTLLSRKYVVKESRDLPNINLRKLYITPSNPTLVESTTEQGGGKSKNKLYMTQLGRNVIDYLCKHFDDSLCSYSFTAAINDQLDLIADNSKIWYDVIQYVYNIFIGTVQEQAQQKRLKQNIDRILVGVEDQSEYHYYMDNYGVVLERTIGDVVDKRRIKESISVVDLTVPRVKEYFSYPIHKGDYKGDAVLIKKGPYGLYCEIGKTRFSVESDTITLVEIIRKFTETNKKLIKEWKNIAILNGPYGPYIKSGKKNVSIPDSIDPTTLTRKQCLELVKNYKPKSRFKKKRFNS